MTRVLYWVPPLIRRTEKGRGGCRRRSVAQAQYFLRHTHCPAQRRAPINVGTWRSQMPDSQPGHMSELKFEDLVYGPGKTERLWWPAPAMAVKAAADLYGSTGGNFPWVVPPPPPAPRRKYGPGNPDSHQTSNRLRELKLEDQVGGRQDVATMSRVQLLAEKLPAVLHGTELGSRHYHTKWILTSTKMLPAQPFTT